MRPEPYRWIAGVISAHKHRRVVGRTRLQKTFKLLQRKGLPTELSYSIHFYGPYSEGLNSELRLLKQYKLVTEEVKESEQSDQHYYEYTATEAAVLPEVQDYAADIRLIEATDSIPLELAATYDAFREMGYDHAESLKRLREKKGRSARTVTRTPHSTFSANLASLRRDTEAVPTAFDAALRERILAVLADVGGVTGRPLFGGYGVFRKGVMFAGVYRTFFMAKLGDGVADALLEPHTSVFQPMGGTKPMTGWLLVDPAGVGTDGELRDWLERAVAAIPKKARKKPPRKKQ